MDYNIEKELGLVPEIHPVFKNVHDDEPLNPEKIAEMLGVSVETVRRWCRTGKLANYNFGGKYVVLGSDFKTYMLNAKSRPKNESRAAQ
jgi:excisionase family DNA binding protein